MIYRAAIERQRPRSGRIADPWTADPWTGLALALTLAGDHDGAAAALAELEGTGVLRAAYLPWRSEDRIEAAVALVREGAWAPSPGKPFPPE